MLLAEPVWVQDSTVTVGRQEVDFAFLSYNVLGWILLPGICLNLGLGYIREISYQEEHFSHFRPEERK